MAKETLYIDANEEITGVIDKVVSAKESVVAIVLPKRATIFQSTVNMKLVKKAAKEANKNIVLITSEPGLTSVAAAAGVHISQSLSSKPAIPKKKKQDADEAIDSKELETADSADVAANKPGVNALSSEPASKDTARDDDEPIELDNTQDVAATEATSKSKPKAKLKFKIPDFTSFKLRLGLGIALIVLLITGWFFGFVVLPKATITIEADTKRVDYTTEIIVDSSEDVLDLETNTVPAQLAEVTKKDEATVKATGKKDVGDRASGTLTLTNCRQGAAGVTIPAGTGFSAEGNTYSTDEAVELGPAVYVGSNCISADFPAFGAVGDVTVTANSPGEDFNISSQSFESPTDGVTAFGSDMTGGTTDIVTVISKDDIKDAEDQLSGTATADAVNELRENLSQDGLQPLDETLQESDAVTKNSRSVDDQAEEVTVTRTVTFSMLGVERSILSELLDKAVKEKLDDDSQNIRDNGLDGAVLQLVSAKSDKKQTLSLQSVAVIGQVFDNEAIKQEVVGKKRGDIETLLEGREGVRRVIVEYEPIWITTTPKSTDKITILVNEVQ